MSTEKLEAKGRGNPLVKFIVSVHWTTLADQHFYSVLLGRGIGYGKSSL